MKRRIAALASCLILGGAGALVAQPAQAAGYLHICNSSASRGPIMITSSSRGGTGYTLQVGVCNDFYDGDNSVRIDPEKTGYPDVDSTWWGFIGHGYDYCDPGEGEINPPTSPASLRYNTDASGC